MPTMAEPSRELEILSKLQHFVTRPDVGRAALLALALVAAVLTVLTARRYVQSIESVRSLTVDIVDLSVQEQATEPRLLIDLQIDKTTANPIQVLAITYVVSVNGQSLGGSQKVLGERVLAVNPLLVSVPLELTAPAQDKIARATANRLLDWELGGRLRLEVAGTRFWVPMRTQAQIALER